MSALSITSCGTPPVPPLPVELSPAAPVVELFVLELAEVVLLLVLVELAALEDEVLALVPALVEVALVEPPGRGSSSAWAQAQSRRADAEAILAFLEEPTSCIRPGSLALYCPSAVPRSRRTRCFSAHQVFLGAPGVSRRTRCFSAHRCSSAAVTAQGANSGGPGVLPATSHRGESTALLGANGSRPLTTLGAASGFVYFCQAPWT